MQIVSMTREHAEAVLEIYQAGVLEHSVYVALAARGKGVGQALLQALIDSTETAAIWTIQSGIVRENTASAALPPRRRIPRDRPPRTHRQTP